jgi:hypothetical protein
LDLPIVKYKKLGTNYIKFLPFEMNRFLLEKGWCLFETKVQDNYMNEEEKEDLDIINKYLNF